MNIRELLRKINNPVNNVRSFFERERNSTGSESLNEQSFLARSEYFEKHSETLAAQFWNSFSLSEKKTYVSLSEHSIGFFENSLEGKFVGDSLHVLKFDTNFSTEDKERMLNDCLWFLELIDKYQENIELNYLPQILSAISNLQQITNFLTKHLEQVNKDISEGVLLERVIVPRIRKYIDEQLFYTDDEFQHSKEVLEELIRDIKLAQPQVTTTNRNSYEDLLKLLNGIISDKHETVEVFNKKIRKLFKLR